MVNQFILLAVLSLIASAISVTLTKSAMFDRLRELASRNNLLHGLVHCPYCMSHWVALALSLGYGLRLVETGWPYMDSAVSALAVVTVSAPLQWMIGKTVLSARPPEPVAH